MAGAVSACLNLPPSTVTRLGTFIVASSKKFKMTFSASEGWFVLFNHNDDE